MPSQPCQEHLEAASYILVGNESDSGASLPTFDADPERQRDLQTSVVYKSDSFHYGFFHALQCWAGTVVESKTFQSTMIALIVANSALMGLATYSIVWEHETREKIFEMLDTIFLLIFTGELALQFLHYGFFQLFQDGWLTFDVWVIVSSWAFSSLQVIRAFRIIRAARLFTKIVELKDLVNALLGVIPKLFAISLLMMLAFYIFGVLFTQLFRTAYADGITDRDYFSSLHQTFFTLFQLMTLENWSSVTRDLMEQYPWAWLPIICFILVSSFIVINLVIAVICDAVSGMHQEERETDIKRIESALTEHNIGVSSHDIARLEARIETLTQLMNELITEQRRQRIQEDSTVLQNPSNEPQHIT
jgi:hypothetical protein